MTNLVDIVGYVKPTALLGLSTIKSAFNQAVIEKMSVINPRPIIFPLSNPVRLSECEFQEAVQWSNGKVIFASGSPFPEQWFGGRTLYPGQGNNMYVFPGESLYYIVCIHRLLSVFGARHWSRRNPLSCIVCYRQHDRSRLAWSC
jgi:malate dehydrogenase (oxaloacetate-decarboxylating)(NADP+)